MASVVAEIKQNQTRAKLVNQSFNNKASISIGCLSYTTNQPMNIGEGLYNQGIKVCKWLCKLFKSCHIVYSTVQWLGVKSSRNVCSTKFDWAVLYILYTVRTVQYLPTSLYTYSTEFSVNLYCTLYTVYSTWSMHVRLCVCRRYWMDGWPERKEMKSLFRIFSSLVLKSFLHAFHPFVMHSYWKPLSCRPDS